MCRYLKSLRPDYWCRGWFVVILFVSVLAAHPSAHAIDGVQAGTSSSESIPFRKAEHSAGYTLPLRVLVGLTIVLAVGFIAVVVLKKYFPAVYGYGASDARKIQLLEVRRLTPRTTLFAVQFEGRLLLLAQSGDRISRICLINENTVQDKSPENEIRHL